jgi:hypothetical protein
MRRKIIPLRINVRRPALGAYFRNGTGAPPRSRTRLFRRGAGQGGILGAIESAVSSPTGSGVTGTSAVGNALSGLGGVTGTSVGTLTNTLLGAGLSAAGISSLYSTVANSGSLTASQAATLAQEQAYAAQLAASQKSSTSTTTVILLVGAAVLVFALMGKKK